jgi:aspartate carbamoyltransferase regulatory subunit
MSNTLVCPNCSGTKHYSVFNYDERKKFMLKCNYCNEKGEVEITEEVIKKLEEDKGVN